MFDIAKAREDRASWVTGTDCMTCHVANNSVVTRPEFEGRNSNPDVSIYCNPIGSKFYSTNLNCVSCHIYETHTIIDNTKKGIISGETNCLKCHQEYDAQGKGTHYFFWRHDDESGKVRDKPLSGVFEGVMLELEEEEGRVVLNFEWKNTISPHSFSECGEVVLDIEVLSQTGEVIFTATERLNRKKFHDQDLKPLFVDKDIPGTDGYTFEIFDPPLNKSYLLPVKTMEEVKGAKLIGYQKAQYWSSDKLAHKVYDEEIAF